MLGRSLAPPLKEPTLKEPSYQGSILDFEEHPEIPTSLSVAGHLLTHTHTHTLSHTHSHSLTHTHTNTHTHTQTLTHTHAPSRCLSPAWRHSPLSQSPGEW